VSCAICNGTGWKLVDQDGRSAVTRCDCWRDTYLDRLLTDARIPRRYHHCDLDRMVLYENASLARAVEQARSLVERFPIVSKGLFFLGPPGVGKTHLAVAVLKNVIRAKRAHGLFYDTRDLLRVIRATYNPVVQMTEHEVLRPVMDAELLVLDDLGAEKTTEWVEETLNLIVNTRYNERRVTIFTSNYEDRPDPSDPDSLLCRVGFRMRSRLHEMCDFIEIDGADYRELPVNGGEFELRALWKNRRPASSTKRTPPSRSGGQLRARPPQDAPDLKWAGGKAGT